MKTNIFVFNFRSAHGPTKLAVSTGAVNHQMHPIQLFLLQTLHQSHLIPQLMLQTLNQLLLTRPLLLQTYPPWFPIHQPLLPRHQLHLTPQPPLQTLLQPPILLALPALQAQSTLLIDARKAATLPLGPMLSAINTTLVLETSSK